jgi:hypothetical protein
LKLLAGNGLHYLPAFANDVDSFAEDQSKTDFREAAVKDGPVENSGGYVVA